MRNKSLAVLVITLLLLLPVSVGARSLFNVSLGFGAAYNPDNPQGFEEGISNPDNWMFGGEISARLLFLQAQAMVFPVSCSDSESGVLLIGMGNLSLPLLGSLLTFDLGAGVGVTYVPTSDPDSSAFYTFPDGTKVSDTEMSFGEAVWQGPVYLQAGLGTEIGPIGLKVRCLMESKARFGEVFESQAWWKVIDIESKTLSLVLTLKMF